MQIFSLFQIAGCGSFPRMCCNCHTFVFNKSNLTSQTIVLHVKVGLHLGMQMVIQWCLSKPTNYGGINAILVHLASLEWS